jgi:type VI protein secretion system component Hcp
MTSQIFLILGKKPGAFSGTALVKSILLNQGFWVRGDSLEIPGAIEIESVAHRVGYLRTEWDEHLLNKNDESGELDVLDEDDEEALAAVAPRYFARNKWDSIMGSAAFNDPAFANERMYTKARSVRSQLTRERQRGRTAYGEQLNRRRALQRRAALREDELQQNVNQAELDWGNRPLGNDEEAQGERQRLGGVRDRARLALQNARNNGGEIYNLRQQAQAAHQQFTQLRAQWRRERGAFNQRMYAALRQYNYWDVFLKSYLNGQGMLMGNPITLPIHGNFSFNKRTDVATPRLAMGCSQQAEFPLALFLFIRRIGPGIGGIRNPYLVIGMSGVKIVHWEMDGIDKEKVALSYRQIAYGSLDTAADTNYPNVVSPGSTRCFDRMNFHGSEGGWAAKMMAAVQGLFLAYGLAAKAAGGDL